MNFDFDITFKAESHEGTIRVSAADEEAARAHLAALHPYDLILHTDMDPGDATAIFANKMTNPNGPALGGRALKSLEIVSVTKVIPSYLADFKAELARYGQ